MTRTGRRRWAPWPTSSIRLRLLGGLAALLVVGTLATSTTSGYFLDGFLEQNAQTTLTLNAGKYRDLLAGGPQTINGDQISVLWGAPVGIVAVGADDRELFSTKTARIATRDVIDTADRTPTGRIGQRDDSEMSNSLIAVRVPSPQLTVAWTDGHPDARPTALILFIDTSMDDLSVDSLVRRQLMVIGCSLAALLALAVLVLRLGMKPLAQMATTAHAIAAGSRQERLTIRGGGGEADQLAVAVNDAFDAQARAEATIRTFAADASHELRTPLATISGWLDLYHQGGLKESGLETALEQIDIEAGRMRLLVEELGLLARLDAGRELESSTMPRSSIRRGMSPSSPPARPTSSAMPRGCRRYCATWSGTPSSTPPATPPCGSRCSSSKISSRPGWSTMDPESPRRTFPVSSNAFGGRKPVGAEPTAAPGSAWP
jgi:two-component system OmpR family sensor kinase